MTKPRSWRRRAAAVFSTVAAASISPLAAQGCAMCKSSIAAQNEALINSINAGILILLFPPLLIISAILYFAFREPRQSAPPATPPRN